MNHQMTTAQIILGLLTIVGSGVVSAIVTYKLNALRAEKLFMRQKLEECFTAVHHFCIGLFVAHAPYGNALSGKSTWDDAVELVQEKIKNHDKQDWPTIEKLVNLYFPSLEPNLSQLQAIKDRLFECNRAALESYLAQKGVLQRKDEYAGAIRDLGDIERNFKRAMFQVAKRWR